MTAPTKRSRRKSPRWPGYTIAQFAALPEVNTTEAIIRHAVKTGAVGHVVFNGIKIIPPRERERWRETWGEQSTATAP